MPTKKPKKSKLHLCFDRIPEDEAQLIAWADQAVEINRQNHPADLPEGSFTRLEMALLTSKKWQVGQELTFGFLRANAKIADMARAAFAEIAKYANLKLSETAAASAMIRITDLEEGAYSYLGTDALGIPKAQQTLNLARSWADLGTAIHEGCHAVGMIHEHQSPGAPEDLWNDEVWKAYGGPPNNWSRAMIKSNVIDRYSQNQTQYTTWDRKSIMLYPLDAALLKNPEYATGWNRTLSASDKAFLGSIYPFAAEPPPPPPPPPPGGGADVEMTLDFARKIAAMNLPSGWKVEKRT